MSGKATLYLVVTKVNAPKGSSFNLVLSVGDSKVTLGSGKGRGTSYSLPYKISKEVTNSPDGSSSYRSCVAQINFLDGETTSTTGSVKIKPDEFVNAASIDVKEYTINVPDKEGVSVQIGISIIPDGGAAPSNYAEFGETAKVISTETRQESDSSSHRSHHHSSQPEQPADGSMEGAEEIVESESGRKHRRKRGTKDTNDGTFISDGGHTHKRRHRSHTAQPAAPPPPEPTPTPTPTDPTPTEQPADGSMEGAEEIVESESGRKHRRKRGTKDTNDGTFISDGGHTHKRRHRSHKPADTPATETKPEETKQEPPKQEEPKQEPPKQEEPKQEQPKQEEPKQEQPKPEEPKPEEPKQEPPKKEEPKQEQPKPEEPKQEEAKLEESTPVENSTTQNTLNQISNEIENNPQLAKQVSDLKDVVEKQTNWIRSLYSKLSDHGLSQSLKPGDFPSFPNGIPDISQTLKSRSLKIGGNQDQEDSPSRIENDLQKACQTGEQNPNRIRMRSIPLHAGVNNIEEERYEMNDNIDDGPLRHFHFAKNEIKEPEEPIISTSDGLTLSYSIRNDCFFRPHYNFEMLDISGRFSFEVFQSPFEIEEEPLSIDCKYNPTIEYNSGDGGYPDVPAFSPTRSRFQTEIKNHSSYFINENQDSNPSFIQNRSYGQERGNVFSPTNDRNTQLRISNLDGDATGNEPTFRYNQNSYNRAPTIDNDFHSAFYNSSDRTYIPQNRTNLTINNNNDSTFGVPSNTKRNFNPGYSNSVNENSVSLNGGETNNFINNNSNNNDEFNNFGIITERNIELDQFSNSSNSFSNSNPNANQNSSPNFSPNSTQSLNSQPLLIEQQNQLKQKIQEQMQKQQKQLQKQMDELHQMRKELTEQTQQMQEQMALQMQQQMQIQQQNIQSMQLSMEKKKQMMQLELEKERKQMDNSKQLLELQMEREKELMEKERSKMEKERQTLRQQRLLQEEELLQLKNQRELQQKEMQQLQKLQDLHKQQQQELQEQQEQHIQQRRELQQQQSLSPSSNQQTDQLQQQQPNLFSTNASQQSDPQQQDQPFSSPSNQPFEPQQQFLSSVVSLNQQIETQQLQQQLQNQQDQQFQPIQQEQHENFNLGGNENQFPPFPPQNGSDLYNSKSRQFDCKICTDETIYLPPKKKQEQQAQNQPFSQNQVNNFSSLPTSFQPIPDPDNSIDVNGIIKQEEEEEVDDNQFFGNGSANSLQQPQQILTPGQTLVIQSTEDKINFNQAASLLQNSNNNGINSEAVDKNNNYPQTQLVSLDDDDINVVLHRSNTDVTNKNINKILTFDKSTAPPLLNQTQEASPILNKQRNVKSTNNLDPRNLNSLDDENGGFNNVNNDDESLITNLEKEQIANYQLNPRTIDLRIPKNIVD